MKSYKQFIKENFLDHNKYDDIKILRSYGIRNYTINLDGSIDVDGDVNLTNKGLTKIPLDFRNVTGDFSCGYNKLTTLKGSPKSVGGNFDCYYNQLITLIGGPENVGGNFDCSDNQLTSLKGLENITGNLWCDENNLFNFKGISEFFETEFYCSKNPIHEIYSLFNDDVNCIKWINEYDVIDGNKVILDRLEEVFHQLGMDIPENINLPSYEII